MKEEIRKDYLRRLFIPYRKGNEWKSFIFQYLQGSGNELKKKFWSTQSSSRLCFDLYSWMASDPRFDDIEFEFKLPGLKSGKRQVSPNMDVFFETKNGIYFIESKYTETSNNFNYEKDLPQAYWVEKAEYLNVKGKVVSYPIIERYDNKENVMKEFVKFIKGIKAMAKQEQNSSWFDAKQETCHLLGIVMYALEKKPTKPVHFLNVAANYKKDDSFAEAFRTKAKEMMQRILNEQSIQFDYRLYSVKDFFEKEHFLDKTGYKSDKKVCDLISDKTLYRIQPIL